VKGRSFFERVFFMLYLFVKIFLDLIFPITSIGLDVIFGAKVANVQTIGKWFLFWGMGVGSFVAGVKQIRDPAFTLGEIFHITSQDCAVIVRELGCANVSIGFLGMISLFLPSYRMPVACINGMFLGLLAVQHILIGPVSSHEYIALISDIFLMVVAVCYMASRVSSHKAEE
jgi:hypothetical protein